MSNVKNVNNLSMQDYAKVNDIIEDISNKISIIKSIINLDLDFLEKVNNTGDINKDVIILYELNRLKNDYININLDTLDKLKDIVKDIDNLSEIMEVNNGE